MDFGYKKLYLGGKLVDAASGKKQAIMCPGTDEVVAEVAWAGKEDAQLALEEAQKGFTFWSGLTLAKRAEWMLKLREEVLKNEELLRWAVVYEMGKTYASAEEDIALLADSLAFYPEAMKNMHGEIIPDLEGTHRHQIVNQPAGVAVAYLAWNFPLLNIGYKLGPALAAGCSIIIKPSERSPLSALVLGELMAAIDFPAGVVNFICGDVEEVALPLSSSRIPKVITMIGSSRSGRNVIRDSATSIKHLSMELGGNAPFIVFRDADIDKAVEIGIALKFGNCGQVCVAPNRFLIHEEVYEAFLEKFVEKAKALRIGFGGKDQYDMGPLVSAGDQARILQLIQDDVAAGAELVLGGGIPPQHDKGNFLEPTILTGIDRNSRAFREEVFGPVAAMMTFTDDVQALEWGNDTEFGLVAYLFSSNEAVIRHFSENLNFGEVQVNGVKYAIYLPHGGINESGIGHDCSYLALNDYLVKKRISIAI